MDIKNTTDHTRLAGLMEKGEPVCVTFSDDDAPEGCDLLYCELVMKARYGETFHISSQSCSVGEFILGNTNIVPDAYYFKSGRYIDPDAARNAAMTLPRRNRPYRSIRIEPLSRCRRPFDILILYLIPEKAMRVIQALAYNTGERVHISNIGAASICGDSTVLAHERGLALSFGCKGSRKHSNYPDDELPLGIRADLVEKIEKGLEMIPDTRH